MKDFLHGWIMRFPFLLLVRPNMTLWSASPWWHVHMGIRCHWLRMRLTKFLIKLYFTEFLEFWSLVELFSALVSSWLCFDALCYSTYVELMACVIWSWFSSIVIIFFDNSLILVITRTIGGYAWFTIVRFS